MIDSAEAGFCRSASLAIAAPLSATATSPTDVWVVLEYRGAWASKAWDAAEMPAAVRSKVDAFVAGQPRARIQLVRHVESRDRAEPQLVLASSRPGARGAARFRLRSYDDLVDIDLDAALAVVRAGGVPDGAEPTGLPMLLVCTNGKRDRCCAKWGQPMYDALRFRKDAGVWQTSHVGGHRFAPTLMWLPDGLCFGRVPLADAGRLLDGLLTRSIVDLEWYRGRTALSEAAQAVEHAARVATGALGFDDVVLDEVIDADGHVRGLARVHGIAHRIELVRETTTEIASPSCGKAPEPAERWRTIACERE
jgi:hypothetical protein